MEQLIELWERLTGSINNVRVIARRKQHLTLDQHPLAGVLVAMPGEPFQFLFSQDLALLKPFVILNIAMLGSRFFRSPFSSAFRALRRIITSRVDSSVSGVAEFPAVVAIDGSLIGQA